MNVKQLLKAVPLLSAVLMFSCSRENVVKNDSGQSRISFKISIPHGDPVTYAVHDAEEWSMENLWMCEYKNDGGIWKMVGTPVNIKEFLGGNGPDYTYEKELSPSDKGSRKFVFVANEDMSSLHANSPLSELESRLASKTLDTSSGDLLNEVNGSKRIPMTGKALQNGNDEIATGATQSVNVEMIRIVARIDIENKVPNLEITGVKLFNTNSRSYLCENRKEGKIQNPKGTEKKNSVSPFAELPASFVNGQVMAKAFYLYEGDQESKESASLVEVQGKLSGVSVNYRIPLWKDGNAGFAVIRNHLYKIVLGDGKKPATPGTNIEVGIETDNWNEVTLSETFSMISAVNKSQAGEYDAKTRTMTVDSRPNMFNLISFHFTTLFKNHTKYSVKALNSIDGEETAEWLTPLFNGNSLSIKINSPTDLERIAYVVVTSDADPKAKFVIKMIQKVN